MGLDVHAETIAVAIAEVGGEVRSLRTIPNRAESVRRLIGKLGKPASLKVCYEAGRVPLVACEGEKRSNAALTDQHGHIPPLIFRADQEWAAGAEKRDSTPALTQKGKRVSDLAVEGFCATDGSSRCQFGMGRVVGNIAKAQEIQHYEAALNATLHKEFAGALRWREVADGLG